MNTRVSIALGLVLAVAVGLSCRWEEWNYSDKAGASIFRHRGALLPWQEVQAPPPGPPVVTVTVRKWSYFGFNKFEYNGPPAPVASTTAARLDGKPQ